VKFVMLPLMFSIACVAYQNRDRIADQYHAAYPTDPAKEAAIQSCAARNPAFNRMDADDRQQCYRNNLEPALLPIEAAAAAASASYAYSPSHLASNDIRRQQANDQYLQESMIKAAAARPVVVVPGAFHPAPAPAPAHPQHAASTYRAAAAAAARAATTSYNR
jgi:hypothetical protein